MCLQHTLMALCLAGTKCPGKDSGDRVRTRSSAATGHTPSNKPLLSNAGRSKAKVMKPAVNVFPQKWIICTLHVEYYNLFNDDC